MELPKKKRKKKLYKISFTYPGRYELEMKEKT